MGYIKKETEKIPKSQKKKLRKSKGLTPEQIKRWKETKKIGGVTNTQLKT